MRRAAYPLLLNQFVHLGFEATGIFEERQQRCGASGYPLVGDALKEKARVFVSTEQPGSDASLIAPPASAHPIGTAPGTIHNERADSFERGEPLIQLHGLCGSRLGNLGHRRPELVFSFVLGVAP
jgi:hypothetical protein